MSKLPFFAVIGALALLNGCAKDTTGRGLPVEAGIPDAPSSSPVDTPDAPGPIPDSTPPEQPDGRFRGGGEASVPDASAEAGEVSRAPDATPEAATETPLPQGYPNLLSETGLFTDVTQGTLGEGVRAYAPKYTLWSDGATKRRWLYLPPGKKIDTTDMNYWRYPPGTKAWKEFTRDGVRVETRMLYKAGPDPTDWVMIAYQWKSDLSDAVALPGGMQNANGTQHDIPDRDKCFFCHGNMADRLLGVTAIQLSNDQSGVKLADLIDEGRLTAPPAGSFHIPGTAVEEQALGYLHANCGHCHNAQSSVHQQGFSLELWERTEALGSVEETRGFLTTVGRPNTALPQFHIIEPHYPNRSELFIRMGIRGAGGVATQMPPAATELPDTAGGIAKVQAWIESMPAASDGGAPDGG